jgi:hypothetical protein
MRVARCLAAGAGILAAGYATCAAIAWTRFGRARSPHPDQLLDHFLPDYDVVESDHLPVAAPAETTLAAATALDLLASPLTRAIFKTREHIMGSASQHANQKTALIEQVTSWGLRILAEKPGREIVFGAVTRPWRADVVFEPLGPEQFASFQEPGYVKIAWTLRAHPMGSSRSIACTETRAQATDPAARRRFRRYWSLAAPGAIMIRRIALWRTKKEAERGHSRVSSPMLALRAAPNRPTIPHQTP